jgi:hypothetical protein
MTRTRMRYVAENAEVQATLVTRTAAVRWRRLGKISGWLRRSRHSEWFARCRQGVQTGCHRRPANSLCVYACIGQGEESFDHQRFVGAPTGKEGELTSGTSESY